MIHISASGRTGKENFVSCMRFGLAKEFPDDSIGLAGVFEIKKGSIRAHIMPDFSRKDMLCAAVVDEWLQFFEMHAPLICSSVFVTKLVTFIFLKLITKMILERLLN